MTLGVLVLSLALGASPSAGKGTRFEQGQKLYNQGDVEAALKLLDAAAQEERDPAVLEKVHLLRGQCFSARQDFVRAEDAFALALESNPDASLDPARVDPTVVKLLDAVRTRLTATLIVNSTPPGASLFLDSKNAGVTPQTLQAPIGRHRVEARWGDGPMTPVELVFKPKKEVRIEFVQGQAPPPQLVPVQPDQKPLRPYADLRGVIDVPPVVGSTPTGGIDLGGGFEFSSFRVGLYARLFPYLGVIPRGAWVVPVVPKFNVFLEAQLPLLFRSGGVGFGLGGAAGGEFLALPWLGLFGALGGQHLFVNTNRADNTTFHANGGLRLRLP
ncbi:MAG: tetratricopeptide repeat protein [Myxococcales bacterium]|nr:tetratricopeptide repeat protein [Myxococcales bacterium]MDP3500679.1 tetratricopeptide repeat protein [Myxococcales bacterium]